MIINIPLQVDDEMINSVIAKDYQAKIEQNLTKQVEAAIKNRSRSYYSKSVSDGLFCMAEEAVDKVISEYKEEVIDRAADKLAERLARTKKAKEIFDNLVDEKVNEQLHMERVWASGDQGFE